MGDSLSFLFYSAATEDQCDNTDHFSDDTMFSVCQSTMHCLWCNDTGNVGCISMQQYCAGHVNCNKTQLFWPKAYTDEDGFKNYTPATCTQYSVVFTFSIIFVTTICCICPLFMGICLVKENELTTNPTYKFILILSAIFSMLFCITLVALLLDDVNDFIMYHMIWWFSFIWNFLIILPTAVTVYFAIVSIRIISKTIKYSQKSVHSVCLLLIYVAWWIIFFILIGLVLYSIVAHHRFIKAASYFSLSVLFFDLWHPVNQIQNQSSNALIKQYFGLNVCTKYCDCIIQKLCPRTFEKYTVLNEHLNVDNPQRINIAHNDEKQEIEENKYEQEHLKKRDQSEECNLRYWEFIVYTSYICLFVIFSLIHEEYQSCLLSLATFLPTLVNVFMFLKQEKSEMNQRKKSIGCFLCVIIFAIMVLCSLITFTILSCTCRDENNHEEDDVCEWPHIMVIATVVLFVVAHLHQKKYCIADHSNE